MPQAVIHINDAALTIGTAAGERYSEPGYARLAETIATGESARTRAWLEPQLTFNQYWQQLNQNPLPTPNKLARHSADIAYTQLRHLLAAVAPVQQVALAVPGNFNSDQLSLLLGMVRALSLETVAVVDSALVACIGGDGPALHVDMQLHDTVVSVLAVRGGDLTVAEQDVLPGLGVARLYNQLARAIAEQIIDATRFDPLHNPDTEQWLFDHLPRWLAELRWRDDIGLSMDTPVGERPFKLSAAAVGALIDSRLSALDGLRRRYRDYPLVFSATAAPFVPLADRAADATLLPADGVVANSLRYLPPLLVPGGDLVKISAAPIAEATAAESAGSVVGAAGGSQPLSPTVTDLHLLVDHRAFSLAQPLSLLRTGDTFEARRGICDGAVLVLVQEGGELVTLRRADAVEVTLPTAAAPGNAITVADHSLFLVEVARG